MKPGLSASEKNEVVRAAYRQVFERDITRAYSLSVSDLESKVKNNEISMKEFVRRLAKSPSTARISSSHTLTAVRWNSRSVIFWDVVLAPVKKFKNISRSSLTVG